MGIVETGTLNRNIFRSPTARNQQYCKCVVVPKVSPHVEDESKQHGGHQGDKKKVLGMARKLLTDARETSYWI